MITLNGIPNMNRFFDAVDHCSGPVIAEFPESGEFDLKHSSIIRSSLKSMANGYQGSFSMKLDNAGDTLRIIDYMAHSWC